MVLKIDNTLVSEVPSSSQLFCTKNPVLKEYSDKFKAENVRLVGRENVLYVYQSEFAVVSSHENRVVIVGSDSATTCHIAIIKHPVGSVAVTHFDGSNYERQGIDLMIKKLVTIDGEPEEFHVYMSGGYIPPSGTREAMLNESEKLSYKLLNIFSKSNYIFNLKLWSTCHLNTTWTANEPRPAVYGMAIDRTTDAVFPAHFPHQDPDITIRGASHWAGSSSGMRELYNTEDNTFSIPPFSYSRDFPFEYYFKLSDKQLLQRCSTSPSVEPPDFCQRLRESFSVFINYSSPCVLFPGNQPRKYIMNSNGIWELIKN